MQSGFGVEMSASEVQVAERRRHEKVGLAAAGDQVSGHVEAVVQHVLGRCRLVVQVACVDLGAVVEQVLGDLDCGGEMKRRLAIAAAGMDELGVSLNQLTKSVEQAQPRRGVNVHDRSALDRIGG